MRIEQHLEMTLSESMDKELTELLQHAFPSIYPNRRHFKQLPHLRLIAYEDERIIGQVGLDFRVMNVDGEAIHVLGIIDLCVREEVRGRGVGRALMEKVIALGEEYSIDFLLLFADRTDLYERIGFHTVSNACTWLKINDENQTTRGIGEASFEELMIRQVGDKRWTDGTLDLLGYLY
ncbi:GNAT family N-acetyltransferase [Exiguobacterium sp. NG55]|uniref:GNAT family N-acetyltransferase n=1 Tax=Exiguobacterium sp. NG55 TaxID=375477 RepID=UPI0004DECD2B|nr:GNAT family N-acetyltransferase [Exiguobacterium sp. NG55]